MKDLTFIDTTLRDGQMSLWATGMRTDMILPIAATLDRAGFDAVEICATGFEKKLVRDLREDLWERVRLVRAQMQRTPLRLIRGRHLAAFQFTPASVEQLWWERAAAHGVRQARLADSSNTVPYLKVLVERARQVGIDPIANLIFSVSPKHTDEYYAQKAREIATLKPMRICLKDPGGLLTPERTKTLVPIIVANIGNIPLEFHTHCNTGLGPLCCLEAIKIGLTLINTAIPPLSDGPSNPSVFNVIQNARAFGCSTALDEDAVRAVERHFRRIARRGKFPVGAPVRYDATQYIHQIPGGMISNLQHQLERIGLADRLAGVLEEAAEVRADLGYPIMVTPYSQFVGVQAVMNIVTGSRYKEVSDEIIQYALGQAGEEESASIKPEIKARILDRPRAREMAQQRIEEQTLDEIRRQYGGPGISDDEILLRYLAGEGPVAMMRSQAPTWTCNGFEPAETLIKAVNASRGIRYLRVMKGGTSLTLKGEQRSTR